MSKTYLATLGDDGKVPAAQLPTDQVGGIARVGVGSPASGLGNDGDTYFERNSAGETVGEWMKSSGAWAKVLAPLPFCYASSLQPSLAIPINTYVPIPWDDVQDDATGMINPAQPTRVNIIRSGYYHLWATWGYSINGTSTRHWVIVKNGDTTNGFLFYKIRNDVSSTGNMRDVAERKVRLQAGDYIEFVARQAAGALTLERSPGISPYMGVDMLRP